MAYVRAISYLAEIVECLSTICLVHFPERVPLDLLLYPIILLQYHSLLMDSDSECSVIDLTLSTESDEDSVVLLSDPPSPSKTR